MSEIIWTGEVRRVLYRQLVKEFGPFAKWEGTSSPGRGHDERFNQLCEEFARVIGAESGRAVKQQIRFAMPESGGGSNWDQGHARTAILNKAAALEAEFIENKHLPSLRATGRAPALEDL
jgi:hypothetical protein